VAYTAGAMAAGSAVAAAVTGAGTELRELMLMGLVTGAAVGGAQSILLARGGPASATWTAVTAASWPLGWLTTWAYLTDIERGDYVFGAGGALLVTASLARREAVDIVFQSFNRYLGVAVGEHLGYGLTGAWTTLAGVALTQTSAVPGWVGVVGIVIGPVLMVCSLEFVGRHEPTGWKLAERLTQLTYIAWSLWLVATGVALLA
jgi:uncharacterized protein DUF4386